MTTEPLITSSELAAELQVPLRTLDQWSHAGTGPDFIKVGRHRRYRRVDIQAWLEAKTVHPQVSA